VCAVQHRTPGAVAAQGTSNSKGVRFPELAWTPRSDWINVCDAGAKGDGLADDTVAIQQVLDRLSDKQPAGKAQQHVVYFPPGKYRITRTLTITESSGAWLVGHGRATVISWDGEDGGRMYWSNACRDVLYEGLVWNGRGKAATLIEHQSQSYYETWIRYLHCAFVNGREQGVVVGLNPAKNQSAELWFKNCLFANCGAGASFLEFNDYDNLFDGCEFTDCGIGVHAVRGNFQVRGCRFLRSRVADVKQDNTSHGSSLRFCVSTGSRRFLETCGGTVPVGVQIQGCRVEGWTAADGALRLGHPGPYTLFDCVFSAPPSPTPPVVLAESRDHSQSLVVCGNVVPSRMALFAAGAQGVITEIPAGRHKPVAPERGQGFLCDAVRIPGKVFDAKVDFGAKGDGKTDDTDAIQRTIDAARDHGNDAIAYLPGGDYAISRTLKVTGARYYMGGIGMATRLHWKGEAGGVAIHVDTPQDIVIENFWFEEANDTYTRIRQTAGGPSSILYDQLVVSKYNDPTEGLLCENLPETAKVRFGEFMGKLRLADCGRADIFSLINYGPAIIDGAEQPKTGFTGLMFHNAACPSYALTVRDNQDVVVGDYYMEQSTHYLLCEGGKRQGKGHVTIGASKISSKDPEAVTVRNYEGRIWIGGGDAQCDVDREKPLHIAHEGTRPVWLMFAGNTWNVEPLLTSGKGGHIVRLGDLTSKELRPSLMGRMPKVGLREMAAAVDDFRQLGTVYLESYSEGEPNGAIEPAKHDVRKAGR
jgi:hypothetical protein